MRLDVTRSLLAAISIALSVTIACGAIGRKRPAPESSGTDMFTSYLAYDHFVKGDLYEQSGNLDSAAVEYRKAIIYDPSSAEIKRSLSSVYFRQRKFDDAAIMRSEVADKTAEDYNFIGDCLRYTNDLSGAADFYQRSTELDSTQVMPRLYLARIYQLMKKYNEAEKQYKYVVRYAPDKVGSLMDLGEFYLKLNKLDEAIDVYSQATAADSTDIRPVIGLASVYLVRGDTLKADTLYFSIAQKNWDNPRLLNSIIVTFFTIKDFADAERIAARILELTPDDVEAQQRYAMILFSNRKYAQAESLMMDLEQQGEADASIFYYLARMKQDESNLPAAEEYYRKSLALADTLVDSWVNLALVVNSQGRYQDALGIMRQAMETIPQDSNAILFYAAVIHGRNEQFELARDGYLRLVQSMPNDIEIRFNLGAAYERLGQFEDSEREFKWILAKNPENALALNYLGYMYADRNVHLKEAKQMIEKALAGEPDNGAFLDSYAWVLYRMGKYDEALVQMKKALNSEQKDPILYDHEGDIYSALNNPEMARESWSKALELDPKNDVIRAKLNPR